LVLTSGPRAFSLPFRPPSSPTPFRPSLLLTSAVPDLYPCR
jgi:hypothetical protein